MGREGQHGIMQRIKCSFSYSGYQAHGCSLCHEDSFYVIYTYYFYVLIFNKKFLELHMYMHKHT